MSSATLKYGKILWDVEYDYEPAILNGDLEEIELIAIHLNGHEDDLIEFLDEFVLDNLVESISIHESGQRDCGPL
jgi:hypothetical protein